MKKTLYLASQSKARRELLSLSGLRFKVFPSAAPEVMKGGRTFAGLAMANARAKAEDVAGKVKRGLVVGADTIVVQGTTVYGKPKDMAAARLMLRKLSRKPHWLYTGVAVVDAASGKAFLDYEKTKVFMDPLSDAQIKAYFSLVNPLDKAGGFDIQGKGAFFIRRIEGCFYTVVGLPLRKLYLLLAKAGVRVFLHFLVCGAGLAALGLFASGCSPEYNIVTGKEEAYMYSTDREVKMGEAIDRQVMEEYKPVDDPLIQARVEEIGKKIAAVVDRKDIEYTFRVIKDDEVNAFSIPGGFVYVNSGLVDKCKNDDELAGVLGHEVGHIVARHSIKRLQANNGYLLGRLLTLAVPKAPGGGAVGATADAALTELMLGYSREDELLADQLAARYSKRAGYNPEGILTFLTTLQKVDRRQPLRPMNYFKTHPYVPDRIRVVKQELGKQINFQDYINIEQQPHGE